MIKDLGLHLRRDAKTLLEKFEPDDLELRKRLYLSAYVWDKSISLCLGRQPSLSEMPYPPYSLLDDADNSKPWSPFNLSSSEQYPQPTQGYITETFSHLADLAIIINEMYTIVYQPRNASHILHSGIYRLENKLRTFYKGLPAHLCFSDPNLVSPPPHVLALNILYHTIMILLFRPFCLHGKKVHDAQPTQHATRVCAEEAKMVNGCFQAYGRTFQHRNQTFLLSYCVYTAATIELQQIKRSNSEDAYAASQRLDTTLKMLEAETVQTPGVRGSFDMIRSRVMQGVEHELASDSLSFEAEDALASASSPHAQPLNNTILADPEVNMHQLFAPTFQGLDHCAEDLSWLQADDLDVSGGFGLYDQTTWYDNRM